MMKNNFRKEFQRSIIDGLTADEDTRRADLAAYWQNWVFNGIFTFGIVDLSKTLKYLPIV